MKRLDLTEIARADLASIRRYSTRTWGREQTINYMNAIRDAMKGLIGGTVIARSRDDLRPGIQVATSGRHCIFFESDETRVMVVRVLHDSMDYRRHLGAAEDRRTSPEPLRQRCRPDPLTLIGRPLLRQRGSRPAGPGRASLAASSSSHSSKR